MKVPVNKPYWELKDQVPLTSEQLVPPGVNLWVPDQLMALVPIIVADAPAIVQVRIPPELAHPDCVLPVLEPKSFPFKMIWVTICCSLFPPPLTVVALNVCVTPDSNSG